MNPLSAGMDLMSAASDVAAAGKSPVTRPVRGAAHGMPPQGRTLGGKVGTPSFQSMMDHAVGETAADGAGTADPKAPLEKAAGSAAKAPTRSRDRALSTLEDAWHSLADPQGLLHSAQQAASQHAQNALSHGPSVNVVPAAVAVESAVAAPLKALARHAGTDALQHAQDAARTSPPPEREAAAREKGNAAAPPAEPSVVTPHAPQGAPAAPVEDTRAASSAHAVAPPPSTLALPQDGHVHMAGPHLASITLASSDAAAADLTVRLRMSGGNVTLHVSGMAPGVLAAYAPAMGAALAEQGLRLRDVQMSNSDGGGGSSADRGEERSRGAGREGSARGLSAVGAGGRSGRHA